MPRSRIAGSHGNCMFSFFKGISILFSIVATPIYISCLIFWGTQQVYHFVFPPTVHRGCNFTTWSPMLVFRFVLHFDNSQCIYGRILISLTLAVCRAVLHSFVQLFATLWTVARQAPLSTWFFRQEYWSGLPSPSRGDLLNSRIERMSPTFPALLMDSLSTDPLGKFCAYHILLITLNYPQAKSPWVYLIDLLSFINVVSCSLKPSRAFFFHLPSHFFHLSEWSSSFPREWQK